MRVEDYPPQEPFTEIGAQYHAEVLRRGAGITGRELSYGEDPYQSLAVFPAARPNGDVLVFMHGGGWTSGYKEWMAFMAPALNQAGVTFVSLGFRLAPATVFPQSYDDVLDGFAAVHRSVSDHGGDPGRLFVGGHSAGGHYAALMALRNDWQVLRDLPSDVVRGCLPISATYYFGRGSGLAMRPRFLGAGGSDVETAASPMRFVRPTAPPFLLAHGDGDFQHLSRQAREFEAALKAAGVAVERVELPNCNHLSASYVSGDPDGPWVSRATTWMRQV